MILLAQALLHGTTFVNIADADDESKESVKI
jgi:hypothetical protein